MRFLSSTLLLAFGAIGSAATFPGLKLADGFRAELFAGSNLVGNAVAICFDHVGRLYSVEANRRTTGTWGVTMSRWWSMEDYGNATLEDRAEMYARWAHIVPPAKLTRDADLLRRIEDADHDGSADRSRVLDRFNGPLEGNAAGVLAWDDQLLIANAPTLWRAPLDQPGRRQALHTGIGVRVGVYGHDLHGLVPGPDGRLYFSIGDRGFHLRTKEGRLLSAPRRGAVFRCFPDGGGLELFHIGLRNPQDLAFNQVGDLFTVDNDMGGVDRSRVVHVVEGGDSGWDATYQLTRNFREETRRADHTEPPWFTERLWETRHEGQPAWLHPPVAHLTQGPSGMEFDPGWGLPEELQNALFVCDFRGSSSRSGIYSFHLEPDGAGWRMTRTNKLAWGILPADIEFGHDGCLYLTDWIGGWGGDGQRRIVRLEFERTRSSRQADEVRRLMSGDWRNHPRNELADLLGHFDRRIRLQSQYELARRSEREVFRKVATNPAGAFKQRLQALFGLWQIGLRHPPHDEDLAALASLSKDPHAELRAQAAKVLGEVGSDRLAPRLAEMLADPAARVRFFAAVGLGRIGGIEMVQPLIDLLRRERDPVVRHGSVLALSRLASADQLGTLRRDLAPRIRMAAVLALRRRQSPVIARFLDDPDPEVRQEAIRAAHDLDIPAAMDALATHSTDHRIADQDVPFPVRHRLINARFRRGRAEDAALLASMAVDTDQPHAVRAEVLSALEHWTEPSPFDRVTWHHRPVADGREARIRPVIAGPILQIIDTAGETSLRTRAARLVTRFGLGNESQLIALLKNDDLRSETREQIFSALETRRSARLIEVCRELLKDREGALRVRAAEHLHPAADAISVLEQLWNSDSEPEKKLMLSRTNLMRGRWGTALLTRELRREMAAGISALSLDLLNAASASTDSQLGGLAKAWRKRLAGGTNSLGDYALALVGGNPTNGRELFATHAVQCVRCHKIKGFGGDAGPELTRIGRALKRRDIVLALIEPSARIAPGFGMFEFGLTDGEEVSGFVEKEDVTTITLLTMDGRRRRLPVPSIRKRSDPSSAMPTMRNVLTPAEVRDLAAYLSSLR